MKRLITILICLCLIGGSFYKYDYITDKLANYLYSDPVIVLEDKNSYAKNEDYEFIKISKDYIPYSYQDLLNIFYTTLDAGYEKMVFYCPKEYENCINDVERISNRDNIETLTTLGNYVSPFNNFKSLKVEYDLTGEVILYIEKTYTKEEIDVVNKKIDEIYKKIVKSDMTNDEIIYAFHDYIINHTKYDSLYEKELKNYENKLKKYETDLSKLEKDSNEYINLEKEYITFKNKQPTTHNSSKANGPLFEGYGICSGYTDIMAIVLDRLKIKNYKIASQTHVWNAIYINNKWLHLDATWDDPYNDNTDYLLHKFYLIDTSSLKEFDIDDHNFNSSLYPELK